MDHILETFEEGWFEKYHDYILLQGRIAHIKEMLANNQWISLGEYYSSWRNSTWYWAVDEEYNEYHIARRLYSKGKWRIA